MKKTGQNTKAAAKKKRGKNDATPGKAGSGETEKKDYWDRITDDPASGYGADEIPEGKDEENQLNVDQEPHDSERGDT